MANVRIVLHKDEIMADIKAIAHVTGRRLLTPDNMDKASDIQTPEEGPDLDIVARALSSAFDNIKHVCSRYLNVGRLEDFNSLEDISGDYVINLNMPLRWNYSATSRIKSLMHEHIVCYGLYSIFEKTNPEDATIYLEKASGQLSLIKPALELRTGPIRRRIDPFI
jgi:hypothetical protein